jgi:hypothetical protein
MKVDEQIRDQIIFALADDNEIMTAALDPDSDLDEEDKQMNRELIKQHEAIIDKVEKGQQLTQNELQIVRDANEIHVNDEDDYNEHHQAAMALNDWLDMVTELSSKKAFEILEKHLDKDPATPRIVLRALHTVWEEITPNYTVPCFDHEGRCLKCGSKV